MNNQLKLMSIMIKAFIKSICCILYLATASTAIGQNTETTAFDYKRDFRAILTKTQDDESGLAYKKLLPRFLDRDTSLSKAEMLALLIGFTEDSHYKPFEDMETEKEIFDLNDQKDFTEGIASGRTYLQTHPLSLRVLKEVSYSYHMLKNEDSANYYMDLVDKVMEAMIYSGIGKKPDAPIFSLGLSDGEYFIENIGMKVLNKNTDWNKDNQFMEIIDASKNMDDHINYFFVIQHAKEKNDDEKVNDSTDKKKKKPKFDKKSKDKEKEKVKEKPKFDKKSKKDKLVNEPVLPVSTDSLQNKN